MDQKPDLETKCLEALYEFLNCSKDEKAVNLTALNEAIDQTRKDTDLSREDVLGYLQSHRYWEYARARRERQQRRV